MRHLRIVSALIAVALVAALTVGMSGSAEAVKRYVPIKGYTSKGKFFIRGRLDADLVKKKISVERQVRPGAKWQKWKKVYINKKGIYRIRVSRVDGSPATCYRISVRALNGYEKSRSRPKCVVRVG